MMDQKSVRSNQFRGNSRDNSIIMDLADRNTLKRTRQRSSSDPMNSSSFLNIRKKGLVKDRSASTDRLDAFESRPVFSRTTSVTSAALQQSIQASGVRGSILPTTQDSLQDALDLMRDDSAGEVDLEQCLALFRQMSSRDNNVIEIPSDVSNPLTRFPSDTIAMSMSNPPYPPSLPPLPQRSAALSIQSVKSVNVTEELLNMLEGNQQPTMQQLSIQQPPMNYNNPPMIIQPIINSTYMAPSVPSPHLLQHPHISPTYPPPYPHPHHQGVYSAVPSVVYHAYPSSVYGPPSPVGSYGYASSSSSYDHHAPPSSYDSTYRPPSGPPSHNPSPHQGEPFDFSSGSADTYQEYMRTDYPSSSGLVGAPYSHPVHPLHHPHYPPSHPGHPDYSTHYENVRIGAGSGTTSKKKKDKAAAASADRANNRGNYHCGRCGMLKANHVCAFVDAPPVTDKGVQTGLVLRSVHPWQGFEGEKFLSVKPHGKSKY